MSSRNMLVPLDVNLIDEGKFIANVNSAIQKIQAELIKHVDTYKLEAKGAKTSAKIEILLVCTDPKTGNYGCAVNISTSLPKMPASVSWLIGGETQTGDKCLLCKKSGSDSDDPKQLKLCTDDGRKIDIDTGEIMTS